MSFEDPFANDLSNFRTVTAGLRRTTASFPMNDGSGARGGAGPPLASPLLPSRGQSDVLSAGGATPSIGRGSAVSDIASLLPSAASGAPVAGRRARGASGAASPLVGTPSSVSPSWQSTAPSLQGPVPLTAPVPQQSAQPSALAWLSDVEPAPSPAASAVHAPSAAPTGGGVPAHMPSFLNFDEAGVRGSVVSPAAQGAVPHPDGSSISVTVQSAAAVDAERRKEELRELYATLSALDLEQDRLDERLAARELKEEAELLALETSVLTKTTELADKEEELTLKQTQLTQHTAERLEALRLRYVRETEAQTAEVHSLDGTRFEKQLQQLRSQCTSVTETLRGLRDQAALATALEPFSEKGIRLALAAAADDAEHLSATSAEASAPPSDRAQSSPAVEAGLRKAVELLRSYCERRLHHARDHLVDHVHNETLAAAHAVRRDRERAWADDACQHKTIFNEYLADMMERYMLFYKERALLKQQNITSLQAELQTTARELRDSAAARLQELLSNVTTKMALSTEQHTKAAEEARRVLHEKAAAVLEGDVAVAVTQRKELESRMLAEAQSRRHRLAAEEESLLSQLQRLRRSSEAAARDGFESLLDSVKTAGPSHAQALGEEMSALKVKVEDAMRGGGALATSSSSSSTSSALRAASSVAHMHAEELLHVVQRAVREEAGRQNTLKLSRQRCEEARSGLVRTLAEDLVRRMQEARSAQHAHQSRLDAQRKMWEAAHRQSLAAACSLLVPVSGATAGVADAQYVTETYAAPQDMVSIALLDVLRDKLQRRHTACEELARSRKECVARCFRLLSDVRAHHESVCGACSDVWHASQTQFAQQSTLHEARVDAERALATVGAQLHRVARDRRTVERECRRVGEATRQLREEAAGCSADARLLSAPLEVLDATQVRWGPPDEEARSLLRTIDPSATNRLPSTNKFTAVHTSTNAAAAAASAQAAATSATAPQDALARVGRRVADGGVASVEASHAQDASTAAATQPWSSALLRAEERLPSPEVDGGEVGRILGGGSRTPQSAHDRHRAERQHRQASSERAVSRSTTTGERWQSSSSRSRSVELPAPADASPWHADAADVRQQQQQHLRGEMAVTGPVQSASVRGHSLAQTWSTLDEFRSSLERSALALRERDAPGDGNTSSFDDSTYFVDLMSCTDSPASSYHPR